MSGVSCGNPYYSKKIIPLENNREAHIEFFDTNQNGNVDFVKGYIINKKNGKDIKEPLFGYWVDAEDDGFSEKDCIIRGEDGKYRFMIPR